MRRWVVWLQVVLMVFGLAACGDKKPVVSESFVFGTRVEVQVAEAVAESRVREAVAQVLAEFDRMHRTLSLIHI